MLIRATEEAPGTTLRGDVCVVGAGAAGITLALELAAAGLRVVLLESGDIGPDPATQALAGGESVGEPIQTLDNQVTLEQTRLRELGGTTNHWAGYCRPLEPIDFATRDHLAVSGWPVTHDEMRRYWERAASWCRITDAEFDTAVWAERSGLPEPLEAGAVMTPIVFQIAFPMPFGEVYRTELENSDAVQVVLGANAVNLATADGRTITGIDVRTLSGTAVRAVARAYVIAMGGIENARLLLASTDADPTGVGNGNDLVGRHFTEHLQVYAGFGVLEPGLDGLIGFQGGDVTIPGGRHAGATHGVKFGIALTEAFVAEERTTGLEIQFVTGTLPTGVPLQEQGATALDVAALMGATQAEPASAVYLQVLAEQRLDPRSRVTLADTTDALGMRRTRLDWRHGADDRAAVRTGLRAIAEELGAAGVGRLQLVPGGVHADAVDNLVPDEFLTLYRSVPDEADPDAFPIGVGFHHMCTTRMAADPREGVVDADCRVHGVDNLWVAGSSVFGTGGVATPTFTIVALATRLADHLRATLL